MCPLGFAAWFTKNMPMEIAIGSIIFRSECCVRRGGSRTARTDAVIIEQAGST